MRIETCSVSFKHANLAEFIGYFFFDFILGKETLVRTRDGIYFPIFRNLPEENDLREKVIDSAYERFEADRGLRMSCFTYYRQYAVCGDGSEIFIGK